MEPEGGAGAVRTLGMALVAFGLPLLVSMVVSGGWVYSRFGSEPMPDGAVAMDQEADGGPARGAADGQFHFGPGFFRRVEGRTFYANSWSWSKPRQRDLWLISHQGVRPEQNDSYSADGPDHGRVFVDDTGSALHGLTLEVRRAP